VIFRLSIQVLSTAGGVGGRSVPHKAKHDEIFAGTYT
jgi:hypothetical protein